MSLKYLKSHPLRGYKSIKFASMLVSLLVSVSLTNAATAQPSEPELPRQMA